MVDKDPASHPPELLLQWKQDHEALIAETRLKGYAQSLVLLQVQRQSPQLAKDIISEFEDHRALWAAFDAEFPERVQESLDRLRRRLKDLRKGLPQGGELDQILQALQKTIVGFFVQVESLDIRKLKCDSNDPDWNRFRDALSALRKSVGLQLFNLCSVYDLTPTAELKRIMPHEIPDFTL